MSGKLDELDWVQIIVNYGELSDSIKALSERVEKDEAEILLLKAHIHEHIRWHSGKSIPPLPPTGPVKFAPVLNDGKADQEWMDSPMGPPNNVIPFDIKISTTDKAYLCECGSVRWCLREDHKLECHECGSVIENCEWKATSKSYPTSTTKSLTPLKNKHTL